MGMGTNVSMKWLIWSDKDNLKTIKTENMAKLIDLKFRNILFSSRMARMEWAV